MQRPRPASKGGKTKPGGTAPRRTAARDRPGRTQTQRPGRTQAQPPPAGTFPPPTGQGAAESKDEASR